MISGFPSRNFPRILAGYANLRGSKMRYPAICRAILRDSGASEEFRQNQALAPFLSPEWRKGGCHVYSPQLTPEMSKKTELIEPSDGLRAYPHEMITDVRQQVVKTSRARLESEAGDETSGVGKFQAIEAKDSKVKGGGP